MGSTALTRWVISMRSDADLTELGGGVGDMDEESNGQWDTHAYTAHTQSKGAAAQQIAFFFVSSSVLILRSPNQDPDTTSPAGPFRVLFFPSAICTFLLGTAPPGLTTTISNTLYYIYVCNEASMQTRSIRANNKDRVVVHPHSSAPPSVST